MRDITLKLVSRLGVLWAPEKIEGPSQRLTYLGIEVETVERVFLLPRVNAMTWKRSWNSGRHGRSVHQTGAPSQLASCRLHRK